MRGFVARFSLVILASLLFAARASADTVFDGKFTGYTSDGANPVVSGVGTNGLVWGDATGLGVGPSSVSYNGFHIATSGVVSGNPFSVARINYFNGTVALNTGISGATLALRPTSDNAVLNSSSGFNLQVRTTTTPNTGSAAENADYLYFENPLKESSFPAYFNVFEGQSAAADLMARLDFITDPAPLTRRSAKATGHYALRILGFSNLQGGGYLTSVPISMVPEPASMGLLLFGSIPTLLVLKRRRGERRSSGS